MHKNRSIAASVRFWMVAVAIAPLLIMAIQGYHCARQAVLQLTADQIGTIARAKQARMADWIGERKREMRTLAAYADLQSLDAQTLFELAQTNSSAYKRIALYSNDWKPLADSGPAGEGGEILLDAAFRGALAKGTDAVVSKPHIHEDGMVGIHIGIPLPGKTKQIVAMLDLSGTIYPLLADPLGRSGARSYIIAADGLFLSPPADGFQPLEKRIELPEEMTRSCQSAVYRDFRGETVMGVSVPLDDLGWLLVAETPTREAFSWLDTLQQRALETGLFTLVLVVLLAVHSARRISRPLRHMAEVAHRVSEGRFSTRMKHFPGREHVEVADAFNRMLDEIERTRTRLAQTAALSAIGELSASIVHEMRNPLSAIKMNLEVLKQAAPDDPVHQELAEIAAEQVFRLETMLGDLLQYGRKVEIKKTAVPVAAFVQELEACIRREENHPVEFSFHNETEEETLPIDREQMLRAVSNLLDNAVQASPPGGTVALALRPSTHPGELLLTVSDQGPGIPDRIAQKLFEPFFTTRAKGTGLGLANVKKIVELHGGHVAFRNTGSGAEFTIALSSGEGAA